jgi:G:T/U-mismatch repair DNA glycosylase
MDEVDMVWDATKVRTHPYNGCEPIPKETKLLIIGTCPPPRFERPSDAGPKRSDDFDFYYGSKDNQLWSCLLKEIFSEDFPDECSKRREFLKCKGIWMHDILEKYRRTACSSKDADLRPVCFADIRGILGKHEAIIALICTGRFAEKWTRRRMVEQKLIKDTDWPAKTRFAQCYEITASLDSKLRKIIACTWLSPVRRTAGRNRRNIPKYKKLLVRCGTC